MGHILVQLNKNLARRHTIIQRYCTLMSSTQLFMYSEALVLTFSIHVVTAKSFVKDSLQNFLAYVSFHPLSQLVFCEFNTKSEISQM